MHSHFCDNDLLSCITCNSENVQQQSISPQAQGTIAVSGATIAFLTGRARPAKILVKALPDDDVYDIHDRAHNNQ